MDGGCAPDVMIPMQLVFSGGVLNAFIWQHVAPAEGARWEILTQQGIDAIIQSAPTCLYDLTVDPGIRTMHVYVRDYETLCVNDKH